jgi:hypothetical protein
VRREHNHGPRTEARAPDESVASTTCDGRRDEVKIKNFTESDCGVVGACVVIQSPRDVQIVRG